MSIWAIADLHLSFGVPDKSMDVFGPRWENHAQRIKENWLKLIKDDDLVLIAGDISWAMRLEEVVPDLQWIHELPGTKVMIRGNHDYWWSSLSKIQTVLPSSIHIVQNNAFNWKDVSIAGARLWDTPEYTFNQFVVRRDNPRERKLLEGEEKPDESEKIFLRELGRLELSLKCLDPKARKKLVMTHYPPIGNDLSPSRASALLNKYGVDICVFGHLHNLQEGLTLFGEKDGVTYLLTACDFLNYVPLKIE
jgi:predicted phosphohydrolase